MFADRRWLRGSLVLALVAAALWGAAETASAQSKKGRNKAQPVAGPADYSSNSFVLHTDLAPDEAEELLKRLEKMLDLISKYWGRPAAGVIEMYVVEDLKKWPEGSLDPRGLSHIQAGGGVTLTQTRSSGQTVVDAKSTVYAVANRGTPQHEAVHAYCGQTFGRTGPTWYSEGMAEMGQYWVDGDSSVHIHDGVLEYLKTSEPKLLLEIVDKNTVTGDSWQNYAWRWALCHLLANNTNYAPRFRPLGLGLLTKQDVSFEEVYGPMAKEIGFEYLFFLKHFDQGYRADLCSWDWKAKFQSARSGQVVASKIDAGHGWQPSKLSVLADTEYEFSVTGTSQLKAGGVQITADGDDSQQGRLVGVIMSDQSDYKLSEPFDLGAFGSFTAPIEGNLYLRVQDDWNKLADNKGKLMVRLKMKGKGNPLPPPKAAASPKEKDKDADDAEEGEKPATKKPVPKAKTPVKKARKPQDDD